jgi:hypothetical protein
VGNVVEPNATKKTHRSIAQQSGYAEQQTKLFLVGIASLKMSKHNIQFNIIPKTHKQHKILK